MNKKEDDRRKYLALQAFYLKVKESMEELEKKLKAKPSDLKHSTVEGSR